MFNFTSDERRVILFLITAALIGLGISFAVKINPRLEKLAKPNPNAVKINLNTATAADLETSRAVSSSLSRKIIEYRNAYGSFGEVQDLKNIKGIGDYRYNKLKDIFYVE